MSPEIFFNFLPHFCIEACVQKLLGHCFWKNWNVTSHLGGREHCRKMKYEEGGFKISERSVTYYLNGSQTLFLNQPIISLNSTVLDNMGRHIVLHFILICGSPTTNRWEPLKHSVVLLPRVRRCAHPRRPH